MRLEPELEQEVISRFLGTCTGQANWYSSNPQEMYFTARLDVLTALNSQILEHYQTEKGTYQGLMQRNEHYMGFCEYLKSEEFRINMGKDYVISEPYLIGSSWTPLRRDDSGIDMMICVKSPTDFFNEVPEEAKHFFCRGLCQGYVTKKDDVMITGNDTITIKTANLTLSVRLVPTRDPQLAVRMTAALNQYDDFLLNFSPLTFYIHSWFRQIRANSRGTEKLAVPWSYTITSLIIHFLQYYELIPHFFIVNPPFDSTNLNPLSYNTIIANKLDAYKPDLYQQYQDFETLRRDRAPNAADLLAMFFFFYGYLVDLPNIAISMLFGEHLEKVGDDKYELTITDGSATFGGEVPDAYRLQYLCRDAFQMIKDTQNGSALTNRLFKMKMDESFNAMRDRIMKSNRSSNTLLQRAYFNSPDFQKDLNNHHSVAKSKIFTTTECGRSNYYRLSEGVPERENYKLKNQKLKFTDEFHAMKFCLKRPLNYRSGGKRATLAQLTVRSGKMFMTTVLPNPNNTGQLSVVFRPPYYHPFRVPFIEDPSLEPAIVEHNATPHCQQTFSDLVRTACFRECEWMNCIRAAHDLNKSSGTAEPELEQPTKEEEERFNRLGLSDTSEQEIRNGVVRFVDFRHHLNQLRESWLAETVGNTHPNLKYSTIFE